MNVKCKIQNVKWTQWAAGIFLVFYFAPAPHQAKAKLNKIIKWKPEAFPRFPTHLAAGVLLALVLGFFIFTPLVFAEPAGFGLEETAGAGGLFGFEADGTTPKAPPSFGPATVAGRIVGYLLAFVGVIFFALMIWGGILWMTARGNTEQVTKAQDLIKSAVIGIAIVFLSYVLTNFVITRLTQGLT